MHRKKEQPEKTRCGPPCLETKVEIKASGTTAAARMHNDGHGVIGWKRKKEREWDGEISAFVCPMGKSFLSPRSEDARQRSRFTLAGVGPAATPFPDSQTTKARQSFVQNQATFYRRLLMFLFVKLSFENKKHRNRIRYIFQISCPKQRNFSIFTLLHLKCAWLSRNARWNEAKK